MREIRRHQHDGPRTGQTNDDQCIMTCETCGVHYVAGMEDMTKDDVTFMMDIINPREDQ